VWKVLGDGGSAVILLIGAGCATIRPTMPSAEIGTIVRREIPPGTNLDETVRRARSLDLRINDPVDRSASRVREGESATLRAEMQAETCPLQMTTYGGEILFYFDAGDRLTRFETQKSAGSP
jgi:hypothetical protein